MKRCLRHLIMGVALLVLLTASPVALARNLEFSDYSESTFSPMPVTQGAPAAKANKDTYLIVVDKATQAVSVLRQDNRKQYTVMVRQMRCSTGRKPNYTPVGTFRIYAKYRWLRAVKNQYVQYACRFNNHILIHSLSYKRTDIKTLITQSYLDLGKPVSAGCVRLCARDSKWIFDNCPSGTRVKVVNSGGPAVAKVEPIPALPAGQTWDPTDPAVPQPAPSSAKPTASHTPAPSHK